MVNGKCYIGQTIKTFNERYNFSGSGAERVLAYLEMRENKKHTYDVELYHNDHLLKAFRKYGVENFEVEIIDNAKNIEELNQKEIYWIEFYDSYNNGYNKCFGGGSTSGWVPSSKTRALWSEMRKGVHTGVKNPNYGMKHSAETRLRMSVARSGKARGKNSPVARSVINLDTGEIFDTITSAAEKYDIDASNIIECCKRTDRGKHGIRKKAAGFRWMYHDEFTTHGDIIGKVKNEHYKQIINLDTNEVFEKITDASNKYKIDPSAITKVCKGKLKTAGGFKWSYFNKE